jgi:hypothetical protein
MTVFLSLGKVLKRHQKKCCGKVDRRRDLANEQAWEKGLALPSLSLRTLGLSFSICNMGWWGLD